jgi:uncharacterized membrane protein YsdA (DUF1294 family)
MIQELGFLYCYLIAVTIVGFILFAINTWLYSHTEESQIDTVLTITAFLGGTLGIVLAILILDRKAKKNMMSRVFVICVFVIQIIAVLMLKGHYNQSLDLAFWRFFGEHKVLIISSDY